MRKMWKTALLTTLGNFVLLAFALFGFSSTSIGVSILFLTLELLLGIVLTIGKESRETGQGLLIGFGLFLLIGGVTCSILLSNINIR